MKTAPTTDELVQELRTTLAQIEEHVLTDYTLADAIREGCSATPQKIGGWIEDGSACALGAAFLAAKARGYIG